MAVVQQGGNGLLSTTTTTTTTNTNTTSISRAVISGVTPPSGVSVSQVNSFRIAAVLGRISSLFLPGNCSDSGELYSLLLSLARGIDYAVANNDTPARALELPSLLKKIYNPKNEPQVQAAVMVLMISVKNACKSGWFLRQDCDELLTLANEIARSFCSPESINVEPSSLPQVISDVMSRFFPRMTIGNVLTSLEVKPGFGAFAVDFNILKDRVSFPQEEIRLFVIHADNIATSSCLTSPPKVNFLLNGKGVNRRIDFSMESGPQPPTDVTAMLKYGTNLLQAVGQFSGKYIIAIALTTTITSSDVPALREYAPPVAAELESDSEIIEGSSRISLNCPISRTRIKTPVKGELCRHHQCFDFENYMDINSRRPTWRCPHCNQFVSYLDIRIDQHMVKVLSEVAENVADVVVSADGSWKAVIENDDQIDEHSNMTDLPDHDGMEICESTRSSNIQSSFVDLTTDNAEENGRLYIDETEDRKPFKDLPPVNSVPGSGLLSETRSTPEAAHSVFPPLEDDFWSGIYFPGSSGPAASANNFMMTPVLTDAVSPALTSVTQTQTFTHSSAQMMQQSQAGNAMITTDFGRQIPRYVNRSPIAIQALPATGQSPASHTSHQHRSHFSPSSVVDSSSSPMMNYPMTQSPDHQGYPYAQNPLQQIIGLPATSQVQNQLQQVVGLASTTQGPANYRDTQNTSMNLGMPQSLIQSLNTHIRSIPTGHRSNTPQVSRTPPAVPVQIQSQRSGSLERARASSVGLNEVVQDSNNWRPSGRMRGSLSGRAYSAALNQFLIQPTVSGQAPTQPHDMTVSPLDVQSQLQALIANNINAHGPGPASSPGNHQ